jgi:hypothetical protein
MGKKGRRFRMKKATLLFIFIVFIITVSGCETVKGALKGELKEQRKIGRLPKV